MLNFYLLEKGLGIVSSSHFADDFSRKMYLILYSIDWPNVIVFTSWDIRPKKYMHACGYPTVPAEKYRP